MSLLSGRACGARRAPRPYPAVVAGTERDLAYFDEVTTHGAWVIGRIEGNFESASPSDLARRAKTLVDASVESQQAATIAELGEAVGVNRAVVGVKAVWNAVRAGRGRVLLVEDDFTYPAREVDETLEPAGDPSEPGVIDDAVDQLVAMVLDNRGEVVIVEPGRLDVHGPIALLLRY